MWWVSWRWLRRWQNSLRQTCHGISSQFDVYVASRLRFNFELLHRNFNLRYRMLYVTMNPSLFQIIFFVTCTASTYMFDAFHVSCSGSLQRKIKQGQGMVHHFRDDVFTCSWLENLLWLMKHHGWTYWSLFRKSWRPCMSYLPKPHGYLVVFSKNEEQTNMNITFNKSPIPAAGKEKLTPAEEGPGCQEGHGQAPSTRADLQASWLCTPSKCSMTHASRFQV